MKPCDWGLLATGALACIALAQSVRSLLTLRKLEEQLRNLRKRDR